MAEKPTSKPITPKTTPAASPAIERLKQKMAANKSGGESAKPPQPGQATTPQSAAAKIEPPKPAQTPTQIEQKKAAFRERQYTNRIGGSGGNFSSGGDEKRSITGGKVVNEHQPIEPFPKDKPGKPKE